MLKLDKLTSCTLGRQDHKCLTAKDLKEIILTVPDDWRIHLSSDEEGNSFHELMAVDINVEKTSLTFWPSHAIVE
jgi:hypothetical protein